MFSIVLALTLCLYVQSGCSIKPWLVTGESSWLCNVKFQHIHFTETLHPASLTLENQMTLWFPWTLTLSDIVYTYLRLQHLRIVGLGGIGSGIEFATDLTCQMMVAMNPYYYHFDWVVQNCSTMFSMQRTSQEVFLGFWLTCVEFRALLHPSQTWFFLVAMFFERQRDPGCAMCWHKPQWKPTKGRSAEIWVVGKSRAAVI